MDTKADRIAAGKDFDGDFDCCCFVHEERDRKSNKFDYHWQLLQLCLLKNCFLTFSIAVMRGHSSAGQCFGVFFVFDNDTTMIRTFAPFTVITFYQRSDGSYCAGPRNCTISHYHLSTDLPPPEISIAMGSVLLRVYQYTTDI